MKTLLALSSLLAAAAAALVFPEMKSTLLLIPVALALLSLGSGCTTTKVQRALRALPEGRFDKVTLDHSNLGIGTALSAEQLDNHNDVVKAGKITLTHNDPWTGKTTIVIENGELDVGTHARAPKKKLNAEVAEPAEKHAPPLPRTRVDAEMPIVLTPPAA